ncbi:phospho-sugar mutase [Vallitalea pronyensis]|uniref:Phosphoglucomutase n=1 Tax=Vallitalea pronyensis TaxID=1348613 RepID=A0A8J8SFJ1_9FIRM|nr:phospho-sugar mutase [Vallitalea pronyensis]QUI21389.1 phospho-sugar mutase [Vallitalea pronyensis]
MTHLDKYTSWLESDYFDEATKQELMTIKEDETDIEERFYKDLEFGTGGLRGVIGAGTNRMNIYTVRKATQGLANYIRQEGDAAADKGVVIAYDSRRMSPEFSDEAALVLAANGIKAYVFESLRPTPELSFAVRELNAVAGIVVTASHNPPEYNGYKVYWEDGAQITSPRDVAIIAEVGKVKDYAHVKTMDKQAAIEKGLYEVIGQDMDDDYMEALKKQLINPEVIQAEADDFTIIYTPLHGTGNIPVRRILKEIGFNKVLVVPEQELPDSDFSTVGYPNPEDIKAFELGIQLGQEKDGDIILATDPDADRLGVLVKHDGAYEALTGNMIGVLLLDYILGQKKEKGILPANGAVIETIVTTNMAKAITAHYDMALIEVLTGFKYIGEKIKEFEEDKSFDYLFGFEESYGCLIGTHARDKDAVVATMLVCEMGAYYKQKGMTLYDALMKAYEKYGYYKETLEAITLKGIEGVNKIKHILSTLRANPPKHIGDVDIVKATDYMEDTDLPKSNVLYYELADESWFCVRPSGTEPKVKFYFGVKDPTSEEASAHLETFVAGVMALIKEIMA